MRITILALITLAAIVLVRPAHADGDKNFFCWDPFVTFSPTAISGGCLNYKEDGTVFLMGVVLTDQGSHAAIVHALVRGHVCGDSLGPYPSYLSIRGAGLQPGCAAPGDEVTFDIGGVRAAETLIWPAYSGPYLMSLTALYEHAWYWYENASSPVQTGAHVQAFVGDTACGVATVSDQPPIAGFLVPGLHGFSRLIVPPAGEQAGCGAPGAMVLFRVDGVRALRTVAWEPGVQRVVLALAADADCSSSIGADDAALMLQRAAGKLAGLPCPEAGDVDGDGRTGAIDALLVLQYVAGIVVQLG